MHTITECHAEENYTLWLRFADGLEGFREPGGIPLDLMIGGVVARKA